MSIIKCEPGDTIDLSVALYDGNESQYPQATVYDTSGTLITTVNLTHSASGLYQGTYAPTGAYKHMSVVYIVYSDSGHTTENTVYSRTMDKLYVNYDYKPQSFGFSTTKATLSGQDKTDIAEMVVKKLNLDDLLIEIRKKSEFNYKKDIVKTDIQIPQINLRGIKEDLLEIKKLSSTKIKDKDYSTNFSKLEKLTNSIKDSLSLDVSSLKTGLSATSKAINDIKFPTTDFTPLLNKFSVIISSLDIEKKEKRNILSSISKSIEQYASESLLEQKKLQLEISKQLVEFTKKADTLEKMLEVFNVQDFDRIKTVLNQLEKINSFMRIFSSMMVNQKLTKEDDLSGIFDLLQSKSKI